MQVCRDLYSAATGDSLPSDETLKLLSEVLYELPDLGDALLRAIGLVHLRLEIHMACLNRSLDELPDVGGTRSVTDYQHAAATRFYQLLALFDVGDKQAAEKKDELQKLWVRIVNLLSSGISPLDRTTVLSCFLSQKSQSMCRWFVKLLDNVDLQSFISQTAASQFSSVYSHSTTPGYTLPISSFSIEQTLSVDNKAVSVSEANIIDNSGFVPSTIDKTEATSHLSSSIDDDVARIIALSASPSHHAAWYHLFLTCFDRKIHFLDLFLVSNRNLYVVLVSTITYRSYVGHNSYSFSKLENTCIFLICAFLSYLHFSFVYYT